MKYVGIRTQMAWIIEKTAVFMKINVRYFLQVTAVWLQQCRDKLCLDTGRVRKIYCHVLYKQQYPFIVMYCTSSSTHLLSCTVQAAVPIAPHPRYNP